MAVVTGVEAERGMVRVSIDGEALHVPKVHFMKCPLREGEAVDREAYIDRLSAVQLNDAYEAALSMLERGDRTEKRLGEALRRRGYAAPAVEAVLARLKENRLIDDARYASRMAELQSGRPVGVYAFRQKLRARGISEEDAAQALEAFDDEQQRAACLEAASRLYKKYEALPPREGKAKLSQALARRGFGWDAVESAVEQIWA